VIACSLETDGTGRATGRLIGGNCRGPEKVRRLREWLGAEPAELWAYGDSAGDDELLAFADHPTRL
jgi:phosphatidylglycerophosphatase C